MKIAYCIHSTFNSGGMERVLANKANWLAEHGYEVTIITDNQLGRPPFFVLDSAVRCIDLGVEYGGAGLLQRVRRRVEAGREHKRKLREVLMRERFDVVVSMFVREVYWLPSIKDGSRKVVEIHYAKNNRIYAAEGAPLLQRLHARLLTWRDARAVRRYDRFVVLSHEDRQQWRGVDAQVIHNAASFLPPRTAALENKQVIALGRLADQKRFDRLIEAWHAVHGRHPDWSLKIYGGGALHDDLQRQIARDGVGGVTIEPPTSEAAARLLESSIYALSSCHEGLPMVLVEAMACGVPCVAMACKCGPRDIITDGIDGLLVGGGDVAGLAEGICRLIEDPEMRRRMGAAARRTVEQRFTTEVIMQQWDELFRGLVLV